MQPDADTMTKGSMLVIGYGNPGRGDDGLGPELVSRLDTLGLEGVHVEVAFQLAVEHAAALAEHDLVVFVDATTEADAPFYFRDVSPVPTDAGFTHHVSPGQVLSIAQACFDARPRCYLLGVRAQQMDDFGEGLTPGASAALEAALTHLVAFLEGQARAPLETGDE